jgi:arylsulfatase A-like enzyme
VGEWGNVVSGWRWGWGARVRRRAAGPSTRWAQALALAFLLVRCAAEPDEPPHVLLVTIDTLRPDYLGFNGYDRDASPFLDRLLAEGTYFERAQSPIGRTTPALASLLTGAYPHRAGVRTLTDRLAEDAIPLAELLRDAGYQTAAIVSNDVLTHARGLGRGFDVYDAQGGERDGAATTAAALGHLPYLDATRPVFAWVHFIDPHAPYAPGAELAERFDPGYQGRFRDAFAFRGRSGDGVSLPKSEATHRNPLSEEVNAHVRRLYAGDIRQTDAAVEALVNGFRERFGERVIVIITADHGESLGEHGFYFDHGDYVYNAGTRVPLGIVLPEEYEVGRGGRCHEWVSLVDVAPTLLQLLEIAAPAGQIEGRSLLPCLRGEPLESRPVFAESGHSFYFDRVKGRRRNDVPGRFRAVTQDGLKLIWTPFARADHEWQLFDVDRDPDETRDVYRSDHPEVGPLKQALAAWMRRARPDPGRTEVREDERRELRALGYLE